MREIKQKDFDNFPVDEYGIKICPSGDYSSVKFKGRECYFGEGCSFGDGCSFGKRYYFGEGCKYMTFTFAKVFCLYGIFKYPIIIYKKEEKYVLSIGCENFKSLTSAVKKAKELGCYCKTTHNVLKELLR